MKWMEEEMVKGSSHKEADAFQEVWEFESKLQTLDSKYRNHTQQRGGLLKLGWALSRWKPCQPPGCSALSSSHTVFPGKGLVTDSKRPGLPMGIPRQSIQKVHETPGAKWISGHDDWPMRHTHGLNWEQGNTWQAALKRGGSCVSVSESWFRGKSSTLWINYVWRYKASNNCSHP